MTVGKSRLVLGMVDLSRILILAIRPFLRGQGQEVMACDSVSPVDRLNGERS